MLPSWPRCPPLELLVIFRTKSVKILEALEALLYILTALAKSEVELETPRLSMLPPTLGRELVELEPILLDTLPLGGLTLPRELTLGSFAPALRRNIRLIGASTGSGPATARTIGLFPLPLVMPFAALDRVDEGTIGSED